MSKNMVEPERTQTIWRLRVACWLSKPTRAQAHTRACAPTHAHTVVRDTYCSFFCGNNGFVNAPHCYIMFLLVQFTAISLCATENFTSVIKFLITKFLHLWKGEGGGGEIQLLDINIPVHKNNIFRVLVLYHDTWVLVRSLFVENFIIHVKGHNRTDWAVTLCLWHFGSS